jgi:hypothetical protein
LDADERGLEQISRTHRILKRKEREDRQDPRKASHFLSHRIHHNEYRVSINGHQKTVSPKLRVTDRAETSSASQKKCDELGVLCDVCLGALGVKHAMDAMTQSM